MLTGFRQVHSCREGFGSCSSQHNRTNIRIVLELFERSPEERHHLQGHGVHRCGIAEPGAVMMGSRMQSNQRHRPRLRGQEIEDRRVYGQSRKRHDYAMGVVCGDSHSGRFSVTITTGYCLVTRIASAITSNVRMFGRKWREN